MKDSELEWFRPLWLRVLITGLVTAWFGWEIFFGREAFWMVISGGALAYAVWNLFITYTAPPPKKQIETTGTGSDGKPEA